MLALAAVAALAAGGCASEPEARGPDGSYTATIASFDGVIAMSVPFLMSSTDIDDQNGVALQFQGVGASSVNAVAAVESGAAEFAAVSTATAMEFAGRRDSIMILGSVVGRSGGLVLRNEAIDRAGLPGNPTTEQKVHALRGMTIATGPVGGAASLELTRILDEFGLRPDADVTVVPVGELPAIVAGLRQGQFDGVYYNLTSIMDTIASGDADVYLSLARGDLGEVFGPGIGAVVITRRETVEQDPEMAERVFTTLVSVEQGIHERPAEIARIVRADYVPALSDDVFELAWSELVPAIPADGRFTREHFDSAVSDAGLTADAPTYEDVVYERARG